MYKVFNRILRDVEERLEQDQNAKSVVNLLAGKSTLVCLFLEVADQSGRKYIPDSTEMQDPDGAVVEELFQQFLDW